MRIPRSIQLFAESASSHMMWRCHNKEHYLRPDSVKRLYLDSVRHGLSDKEIGENVKIHAYCVMDNHYHQATSYQINSEYLSKYMRKAHSIFGQRYNKLFDRSGKVAEARPKTSLVQDLEYEIRVHFYIEANPVRAGLCKPENLRRYKFNSFKFFAYGIKDEFTDLITIPEWYYKLGRNSKERQKKYRKLFYRYLADTESSIWKKEIYEGPLIGSEFWISNQRDALRTRLKYNSR